MKSLNWGTVICSECGTRVSVDDAESSYNAELDDVVFWCSKCIKDPEYSPTVSDDSDEAAEQSVQSDLGGTSAQEVSPNEKDTGEGWGPQGNRPSR